jgi:hypothetical protein
MDLSAYRTDVVRRLVASGDVPCRAPGFLAWATMQGLVTDAPIAKDAPFLWVSSVDKHVYVGGTRWETQDLDGGLVRVGDHVIRFPAELGKGSAVVRLMMLTRSVPAPIDLWERWTRACDVVVASHLISAMGPRVRLSQLELLFCTGAAYSQPPDLTDPHEIVAVRTALRAATKMGWDGGLWWIDLAVPALMVYDHDHGFRARKLVLARCGTRIYTWPRGNLVDAMRHVSLLMAGGRPCLPYVPYDRLVTFLQHVPTKFLPPCLHEATRLHAWRGIPRQFVDNDVIPSMLSFAGDLTMPARVLVSDDTRYVHAFVRLDSASRGRLLLGIADEGTKEIDCDMVIHRQPGMWSEYEGVGWAVRAVSRIMRMHGSVFLEIGVLMHTRLCLALCSDKPYGEAGVGVSVSKVGEPMRPVHQRVRDERMLFGVRPHGDAYGVFIKN